MKPTEAAAQHDRDRESAISALKAQPRSQGAEADQRFAEGAHNVKMQQITEEFKIRRAELESERLELEKSGINGIEREKRLSKIKADEDKAIFDARKRGIAAQGDFERTQNTITANQKWVQQQALWAAEKEQRDRAREERVQSLKKAFSAQGVLNSTDPQKVLQQLRADRALK